MWEWVNLIFGLINVVVSDWRMGVVILGDFIVFDSCFFWGK